MLATIAYGTRPSSSLKFARLSYDDVTFEERF